MNFRFLAGVALLFIAFLLQFFLATAGIFMNFFFAALIAFAFLFTFWELVVLVLMAVFIVNWQPGVSVEIVTFAFYPIAVFFARGLVHMQSWFKNLIAVFIGLFILYVTLAGRTFLYHPQAFLVDLLGGLLFGSVTFFLLRREGN
ncbi:MAG TPA: hypothetical protein VHZ04_00235 [Candidatus Paceibacterota bacterium]|nr:hypothetical protein [Candidatus Paceibacterota bacterium]